MKTLKIRRIRLTSERVSAEDPRPAGASPGVRGPGPLASVAALADYETQVGDCSGWRKQISGRRPFTFSFERAERRKRNYAGAPVKWKAVAFFCAAA